MVLSLWATSIPQKKIKISPEQKFKLLSILKANTLLVLTLHH